jgi:hypothetical protein
VRQYSTLGAVRLQVQQYHSGTAAVQWQYISRDQGRLSKVPTVTCVVVACVRCAKP